MTEHSLESYVRNLHITEIPMESGGVTKMGTLDELDVALVKAAIIVISSTGIVAFFGWLAAKINS